MATGIGATLREARNRRRVDLSEVEAATKIRLRFLRAMENEEWDVLPGGAYTRSFIRTYASYLGLDGERLADEYQGAVSPPPPSPRARPVRPASERRRLALRVPYRVWAVLVPAALIAIVVAIAIAGGGDDDPLPAPARQESREAKRHEGREASRAAPGVALALAARADVWVCLLDAAGEPLVNGEILTAGAKEGPFRSDAFTVSFGNGEVSVLIDGREAEIPVSPSPLGFEIDESGALVPIPEAERPTCT